MNLILRFTALQFLSRQITIHGHMQVLLAGQGTLVCPYIEGQEPYAFEGLIQGKEFDPTGQYGYGPEIAFKAFTAWAEKSGFKPGELSKFIKKYTVWNKGASFETGACKSLVKYKMTSKLPISKLSESHYGACSVECFGNDKSAVLYESEQCIKTAPGTEIPLTGLDALKPNMVCHFLWLALHSPEGIQVYNQVWEVKSVEGGKGGEASGGRDDKKGEGEKKGGEDGGGEYGQDNGTPPKDAPAPKETDQPPPKEAEQPPPQEAEKQLAPQQGGQQSGGPSVEHQGTQQGGQPESGDNYDKTKESDAPAPPASRCTLRQ